MRRLTCSALTSFLVAALSWGCSASPEGGSEVGTGVGANSNINLGGKNEGSKGNINTGGVVPGGIPWPGKDNPIAAEGVDLASAQALFAGASVGVACLSEPQAGTMLPKNWLRPRFRVSGTATAYQVTLSAAEMQKDLVGYGGAEGWTIPLDMWNGIASKAVSAPVVVNATVRVHDGNGISESVTTFTIAPVSAGGAMVYWASNTSKDNVNSSRLEGFSVGEEGTVTALTPLDIAEGDIRNEANAPKPNAAGEWSDSTGAAPGKPSCIGCHTSTPDGLAVAFNDGFPWAGITASIEKETKGARASGVTDLGARLLKTPFIGTIAFSGAHWAPGDRRAVSTMTPWMGGAGPYKEGRNISAAADLVWVNLEAQGDASFGADAAGANAAFTALQDSGWGYLNRNGDTGAAANPNWNPAGDLIAYASVAEVAGGHLGGIDSGPGPKQPETVSPGQTEADLYTVPYNGGAGGDATPVAGAAEPGIAEYYPDFSPDGNFLAFNRAGSTQGYIYYRPDGEINVIPTLGGAPHRLAANDPPACSGEVSPGVINSWPKWGPSVETVGDKTYYWVIFSSARAYPERFVVERDYYTPANLDPGFSDLASNKGARSSQLYLGAVVIEGGQITSYPALYVWNQTKDTSNLTPAWDEFKIPPVDIR